MAPFAALTSSSAIQHVTAVGCRERPVGVVLVPGELATDDRLLDHGAVLHEHDLVGAEQLPGHAGDDGVRVDLPEALVSLPQVEEERDGVRLLLDLGLLGHRTRRPGAHGRLAALGLDDRIGQLVGLRLAAALEMVVERLSCLLHLGVVENANREEKALLVILRDLLGGQRIRADVAHLGSFSLVG